MPDINKLASISRRTLIPVGDPVRLTIPTYDGSGQAVHPSVVYIPQGFGGAGVGGKRKWWAAITPYPGGNDDYENPSVIYALDDEGTIWSSAGITNPIVAPLTAPAFNRDSELVYNPDDNKLYLFWGDSTGKSYYKTSSNGIAWSAAQEITGGPFINQGFVVYNGATPINAPVWEFFGQSIGWGANTVDQFSHQTSSDAITWDNYGGARHNLLGDMWHLGGCADAAGYHFMAAMHPKGSGAQASADNDLYYGFSSDGRNIVFDTVPVLRKGITSWASRQIYKSAIVPYNNIYRVYFSCMSLAEEWSIGYVDCKLNNPSMRGIWTPRPQSVERWLWKSYQLRDTNPHYPGASENYIPEFNQYPNKVLLIRQQLKDAGNAEVKVALTMTSGIRGAATYTSLYRLTGTLPNLTASQDLINLPNGTYYIDKNSLPCLGDVLPGPVSFFLTAAGTATQGDISIMLSAW